MTREQAHMSKATLDQAAVSAKSRGIGPLTINVWVTELMGEPAPENWAVDIELFDGGFYQVSSWSGATKELQVLNG